LAHAYHQVAPGVYGDVNRRQLLVRTGLGLAAAGVGGLEEISAAPRTDAALGWDDVRAQFRLSRSLIHMGGLYLASHPGAFAAQSTVTAAGSTRAPSATCTETATASRRTSSARPARTSVRDPWTSR